ncbi:MAG: glycosyltransferase [Gemmatimonadetes bacterium]|nr:glycosyltransferase [Gemmatimonadota bacterium]
MRIAFFLHSFPEISETFILRQATGLMDLGHTVDIFADQRPAPAPVHEEVERYGLRERTRYLHAAAGRGVGESLSSAAALLRHRGFVLRYLAHERAGLLRDLADLTRLKVIGILPPYDVVHCHFGDIAMRYRFAAAFWQAPLVASFYGFDSSSYPHAEGRRVYAPLFRAAAGVTALSQHMAARLVELGCPAERLHILHIGADPERFRPAATPSVDPSAPVRVLTVARLAEKKGIEYALRAVALAAERRPELRYEVIGDGPLRQPLATLADSLGLSGKVCFHSVQTEEFVQRAMQEADIFLLPSVTAANGDEEGTPTVLMEASSCELPVVSTLHSGIPEVVLDGATGFLVPERDVTALADRLHRLLGNAELRHMLGAAGRRHIETHFDTRKLSRQLEELYHEVLGSGRALLASELEA